MAKASRANWRVILVDIDQPTTRREYRSRITANDTVTNAKDGMEERLVRLYGASRHA